jgi:hypothetical protein
MVVTILAIEPERGTDAPGLIAVGMNHQAMSSISNDTIPKDLPTIALNNPGEIKLYWTAPGDDGNIGRASRYEVRFWGASNGPINNDWKWRRASVVGGAPVPSQAGRTDSMSIGGFPYGAQYYFCLKAYDEVGNQSPLSASIIFTAGDTVASDNCDYLIGDISGDGQRIGGDVTYGVRFFQGLGIAPPDSCYMDSTGSYLYIAGDCNGNCEFRGSDITRLVAYFKGAANLSYCHFFPTTLPRIILEDYRR